MAMPSGVSTIIFMNDPFLFLLTFLAPTSGFPANGKPAHIAKAAPQRTASPLHASPYVERWISCPLTFQTASLQAESLPQVACVPAALCHKPAASTNKRKRAVIFYFPLFRLARAKSYEKNGFRTLLPCFDQPCAPRTPRGASLGVSPRADRTLRITHHLRRSQPHNPLSGDANHP